MTSGPTHEHPTCRQLEQPRSSHSWNRQAIDDLIDMGLLFAVKKTM